MEFTKEWEVAMESRTPEESADLGTYVRGHGEIPHLQGIVVTLLQFVPVLSIPEVTDRLLAMTTWRGGAEFHELTKSLAHLLTRHEPRVASVIPAAAVCAPWISSLFTEKCFNLADRALIFDRLLGDPTGGSLFLKCICVSILGSLKKEMFACTSVEDAVEAAWTAPKSAQVILPQAMGMYAYERNFGHLFKAVEEQTEVLGEVQGKVMETTTAAARIATSATKSAQKKLKGANQWISDEENQKWLQEQAAEKFSSFWGTVSSAAAVAAQKAKEKAQEVAKPHASIPVTAGAVELGDGPKSSTSSTASTAAPTPAAPAASASAADDEYE